MVWVRNKVTYLEGLPLAENLLVLEAEPISPELGAISYELGNPNLPIHAHRQEVIDAISNNSVVILAGPPGSGIPPFSGSVSSGLCSHLSNPLKQPPVFSDTVSSRPRN